MSLRYVLDENLRGSLWDIIQRHNLAGADRLDAVRVGDGQDLPLGTPDPELLLWAEREDRILVSSDKKTMGRHLADHLGAGHHSPGVMTLRPGTPLPRILEYLLLAAFASEPHEWRDQIRFIP